MKLSDYLFEFLAQRQVTHVFTVSGGAIAHLLDSLGRTPQLRYFCNYHEQACAVAAEGYAKMTGKPAVCLVTLGPGAMNALSGVAGAWHDSLPMIVISGQVRTDLIADYSKLRQKGPQEGNIVELAKGVTKYAVSVRDPRQIRHVLERALYLATTGRPGPVWIELPGDVQAAQVEPAELQGFTPEAPDADQAHAAVEKEAAAALDLLRKAERPLVIGGNGIHLAGARAQVRELIERFQIPAAFPYSAKDLLPESHPLNAGVFGTAGQRRANFAVQNADLLLCLGSGLCVSKVGFKFKEFAPGAKKILVDIDEGQVKHQVLTLDLGVQADVKQFVGAMLEQSQGLCYQPAQRWQKACAFWRRRYPIILKEFFEDREHVNMYIFMDRLSDALEPGEVLVTGNGMDVASCYQAFKVKENQRVLLNGNWGSMGWDLPMAIGACLARGGKPVTLVTGDGSIQCNLQELLTVKYHKLPLKIFVFSNQGYGSIRTTQKSMFQSRLVGSDPGSGVGCLDLRKLAALYGLKYQRIATNGQLAKSIEKARAAEGAVLCEVNLSPTQEITPKASAFRRPDGTFESRPLEDMAPFLPREEVEWNMHLFDPGNTAEPSDFERRRRAGKPAMNPA